MPLHRLCYILPKFDENTSEHFYHIYELLEELGQRMDIFLIIETSVSRPKFRNIKKIFCQRFSWLPIRILENLILCFCARLQGYKTFYTHYSTIGGINTSIITKLFDAKALYWNCGLKKEFMVKNWRFDLQTIKQAMLLDLPFLLSLKMADYLVTGTPSMAKYYSSNFGKEQKKIMILPQWVDLHRFDPTKYDGENVRKQLQIGKNKKVVLFVHWLSERKGAQHITHIAEKVKKEVPRVAFLVVGEGPYRKKLAYEIKEKKMKDFVMLTGKIPNKKIPEYYAIADAFMNPSTEEGFPRVLLECMAMGLPFVATDVGGVRDILTEKQSGFIVQKEDIDGFSKKLITILKDKKQRKELAEDGFKNVKRFTKAKAVQRFMNILQATLEQ